jgi:hypothetical protein
MSTFGTDWNFGTGGSQDPSGVLVLGNVDWEAIVLFSGLRQTRRVLL